MEPTLILPVIIVPVIIDSPPPALPPPPPPLPLHDVINPCLEVSSPL
ncbi:MAG: hypothetical protein ACO2PO_15735 [Candidatus Calescibacterium sp.]